MNNQLIEIDTLRNSLKRKRDNSASDKLSFNLSQNGNSTLYNNASQRSELHHALDSMKIDEEELELRNRPVFNYSTSRKTIQRYPIPREIVDAAMSTHSVTKLMSTGDLLIVSENGQTITIFLNFLEEMKGHDKSMVSISFSVNFADISGQSSYSMSEEKKFYDIVQEYYPNTNVLLRKELVIITESAVLYFHNLLPYMQKNVDLKNIDTDACYHKVHLKERNEKVVNYRLNGKYFSFNLYNRLNSYCFPSPNVC
jgi:hypothetical protein